MVLAFRLSSDRQWERGSRSTSSELPGFRILLLYLTLAKTRCVLRGGRILALAAHNGQSFVISLAGQISALVSNDRYLGTPSLGGLVH